MERGLRERLARSTPLLGLGRSEMLIRRDLNRYGSPFLAVAIDSLENRSEESLYGALSDAFQSLRSISEEEFERIRADLVDALAPNTGVDVQLLVLEGLRLSRFGDGRAADVHSGLKQLRYADYRENVLHNLVAGNELRQRAFADSDQALFIIIYAISVGLVVFLMLDAFLGWRAFRLLRASLFRTPQSRHPQASPATRVQTEQLVREIQSWYREQDRLREYPDHRD
jgi:hypothetical protein